MKVWSKTFILFHWSLVFIILSSFISIKAGFDDIHFLIGYALIIPIVIRVFLGTFGNLYEHFSYFKHLKDLKSYLKSKRSQNYIGHNPLALTVMGLILFDVLVIFITGILSESFIEFQGFFVTFSLEISNSVALAVKDIHKFSFIVLLILIALHLLGLSLSYKEEGFKTVKSIFTGRKDEK